MQRVNTRPNLPEPPSDLVVCFQAKVKVPGKRGSELTRAQIHKLITDLMASNDAKSRCGMRALAFLENLRVAK